MGTWQFTPFAGLYAAASLVSFALAGLSWRLRPARGALPFSLMTASAGVWAAGYLLGFFNTDPTWKLAMLRVEYLGATSLSVFWPIFVLSYVHPGLRLSWKILALVSAVPVLTFLQVLAFRHPGLFYRSYEFGWVGDLFLSLKEYGPGFYVWAAYSWLVIVGGAAVFVRGILSMPRLYRAQTLPVVVILVTMLIPNMLYVAGANPFAPYDPTSLSFAVIGLAFMFAMWRSRLFDIVPVAHALVLQELGTGVVILDGTDRILEINDAAVEALGVESRRAVGKGLREVFPGWEPWLAGVYAEDETVRRLEMDSGDRAYELTVSDLSSPGDPGPVGRVVIVFDVTHRKKALEEQTRLAAEARAQVHTLRGLLPICSVCKRIRDDGGYWQEVEEYVRGHTEAEFSHGMCPDCFQEYYGDLMDDEDSGPGG